MVQNKIISQILVALVATVFLVHSSLWADGGTENNVTYIPPMQSPSSQGSGSSGQSDMAKAQQLLGAGMNAATGAMMQKQCKECSANNNPCPWACAMAAMSYAQAVMMGLAALQSDDTGESSSSSTHCYYPPCDGSDGSDDVNGNEDSVGLETKAVPEAPYTASSIPSDVWPYDAKDGVLSTPQGDIEIPPDATPAQIAAALGGGPSDMSAAEAIALRLGEEASKKLREEGRIGPTVSGMGVESYGGGGSSYGGGGGSGGKSLGEILSGYTRKPASATKNTFKQGKSRLLNGEEIGIKMDDIFAMVHRRYQSKRKANDFLETIITEKKK